MTEIKKTVSSKVSETLAIPDDQDVSIAIELEEGGDLELSMPLKNKKPQSISITVTHKAKGTKSNISLNSIVSSTLNVDSRIVMEKGCAGSVGKVALNGINDGGKAGFSPGLVLMDSSSYAEHKSSFQEIPDETVSYLMSRGIAKKSAKSLFCERFLSQ